MIDQPGVAGSQAVKGGSIISLASDYLSMTKPPIIILLVITALGAMFLAAGGPPPLVLVILVCVGGSLGAGGANALNHYLEQDIDSLMSRTRQRPVPGKRIPPRAALAFGVLLNGLAFALLALWVNVLAASLTMAATLFYVLVYTSWLKRNTPHNIVIGGAAGSIPPLVGWAAVTGSLSLPALYLFTIIFFWTPPHFWALALLIEKDYAQARIPMLPVVAGRPTTVANIFLYSVVLIPLTLVFALISTVGWIYLGSAAALGTIFLLFAWQLKRNDSRPRARKLYLYSLLYLALLFVAMIADTTIGL
ncbi:MAG: protoheme IX farnesyltransferase [SAR202 cluster bacterium Io17-Chloro-G2]|nr:MAG: protoheme IX farnesyltransferase [SAR202 cluster bacterium Io17-Chloro-G2]